MTTRASLLLFLLTGVLACSAEYMRPEGRTLRELLVLRRKHFGGNFGGLVLGDDPMNWKSSSTIADEQAIARDHFTILSAGWEMFPGHSWLGDGRYDYAGSDAFIEWCEETAIAVHGHGLGYNHRVGWFKNLPWQTEEQRAEVRRIYERYVRDTMTHFKGRVHLWDVCNEHVAPGGQYQSSRYLTAGWDREARKSVPFPYVEAYRGDLQGPTAGVEWMARTFKLAHEADPEARLIYLDFSNETVCPTSNKIIELVRTLRAAGAPVGGVGFQMHMNTNLKRDWDANAGHGWATTDDYFDSIRENVHRLGDFGLEAWGTELDFGIDAEKDLDAELALQADLYRRLTEVCLDFDNFKGIKMWGVMDAKWNGTPIPGRPYLFDEQGRAKPAFFAVRETLESYHPEAYGEASGRIGPWQLADAAAEGDMIRLRSDGATAARTVDLSGLRKARLRYSWLAEGFSQGGSAAVLLEVSIERGAWAAVKKHDGRYIAWHKGAGEGPFTAYVTLPALPRGRPVETRFRLDGNGALFQAANLELIADAED